MLQTENKYTLTRGLDNTRLRNGSEPFGLVSSMTTLIYGGIRRTPQFTTRLHSTGGLVTRLARFMVGSPKRQSPHQVLLPCSQCPSKRTTAELNTMTTVEVEEFHCYECDIPCVSILPLDDDKTTDPKDIKCTYGHSTPAWELIKKGILKWRLSPVLE